MATMMRYEKFGGPEVLELVEFDVPEPAAGEVLVEVRAAGVNPADGKRRSGIRSSPPPQRIGLDGAGVILAVGPAVDDWAPGDQVVLDDALGTYASHLTTTPEHLTRKPAGISWETAAALGVPIGTAYQALRSLDARPGSTLLVHGGAGAVGQAAIQFATRQGLRVIATGSDRGLPVIERLGATPLAYGEDLVERIRAAAPGGIDIALDTVGREDLLDATLGLVEDRTKIGTVVAGGRAHELGIRAWRGGSPQPLTAQEQRWRHESIGIAIDLIENDGFQVDVARVVPLHRAAEVHRAAESGRSTGKSILTP